MKHIILLVGIVGLALSVNSQSIRGKLLDLSDNRPLSGATLTLTSIKDSTKFYNSVSDTSGVFRFQGITSDSFSLKISFIGYEQSPQLIAVTDSVPDVDLGTLFIPKASKELAGVTVVSQAPPVSQKGDTLQLSASQFKVNPDATTEDLIKKMPGITVDKDGTVTAQGETVKKVTIDGKDFFGDDATAALRNLPSEIVDKIQVFDRLSDQAQFTGFDDGNSQKALNIVTKTGMRNGQFGRVYAGYGTDDRYALGGNMSFFKGNRRISLVGLFNNINQQNFGSQDLLGVTSSSGGGGGRGGGGRGGGNFGGGAGQNNFLVGTQNGISKTNAAGINFSDTWAKKIDVTGSYFYNNSSNLNDQVVRSQTFFDDRTLFADQASTSRSENFNHRINLRLEYRIDSSNTIIFSPSLNFQNNRSYSSSISSSYYGANDTANTSDNNSTNLRSGYSVRNNLLYRHAFAKRGRTISFNLNTSLNQNDGKNYVYSQYRFFESGVFNNDSLQNQLSDNSTNGYNVAANIAYTEPVGKTGQLQFNYSPSYSKNKADQQTFAYDNFGGKYSEFDPLLSNKFDNTTMTNSGGLSYRLGNRDNMFSIGVNLQHSRLESDRVYPSITSIDQSFTNFLPNLMWRKKLSARSSFRLFYRASTNFPSVTQLQDVVNISNPLRVSTGNPDLKQSYTHVVSGRYTFTNTQKQESFLVNVFLQTMSDYISNATYRANADSVIQQGIVLKSGSQLLKPVNLNGYGSVRSLFTYSRPLSFVKSVLNLNAGINYSRLPGLANSIKSITDNYIYNAGVVLASNISEYVDFNLSYNANFNVTKNSQQADLNTNFVNKVAGLQINLLTKNGWFIQNDVNNQTYSGLASGFNQNFWLWNAGIGKKFLKNRAGELKLSVFDLLKQNQSIVRTVSENYIEDSQSEVLQQYFMLTFTYNLKNFGTAPRSAPRRERGTGPNF
ncbi:MAG TPA: outer membrane beta-barrel protein [Chitinophagaceae bacterium]|nr:outer membrane beta-barrel protein [Chitinophagaceae bacterium]